MSFQQIETQFASDLMLGNIKNAKDTLAKNPKIVKLFGAQIWEKALLSKSQSDAVELLINVKCPVYLPRYSAKKVASSLDYTLMLGIKHKCLKLVKYLLANYKINSKLLDNSIIYISNIKEFPEQTEILTLIIELGGNVSHKDQRAIFNATFCTNGKVIALLVEHGAYLINHKCAELFLTTTDQDPLTYLTICTDERSHPAIMDAISMNDRGENPIEHFE